MLRQHHIYRKLLIILLLIAISSASFAQKAGFGVPNLQKYDKKLFHFGFSIGFILSDFNLKSTAYYPDSLYTISSKPIPGFSLGIVTNLRIWKYFDLRFIPGISLAGGSLKYEWKIKHDGGQPTDLTPVYLDLPVLFKIKSSRMHNVRVYVIGGMQYSYNLQSDKKRKDLIERNKNLDSDGPKFIILNKHDLQGQVGFGLDFYCTYFKLTTEIKMSFGMLNLLPKNDDNIFTSNLLTSVKSKTLQISIIFE